MTLVLALVLGWPGVASAARPEACERLKWNDKHEGSLLSTIDIRTPETTAFTFDCVLGYAFDGTQGTAYPEGFEKATKAYQAIVGNTQPHPGIVSNIIENTRGLAWALLGLMFVVQFAFIGLFAGDQAADEMISGMIRLVLVAILLQSYPAVVSGFRQVAVDGSIGAQKFVMAAGASSTVTSFAARGATREQLEQKVAEYTALNERSKRGEQLTTEDQARRAALKEGLDPARCRAEADRLGMTEVPARVQEAQALCAMLEPTSARVQAAFDQVGAVTNAVLSPIETVQAFAAKGVAKVVSLVVEFTVAGILICVSACVALSFALIMAIGQLCIPFMGFKKSAHIGKWWFQNALATALLPVFMAVAMGLYSGTVDYIIQDTANDSPMMVLIGSLLAIPLLGIAMKGGFGLVRQLGGGMATVGIDMAKGAAKLGFAVASGGLAGGVGAGAGGASAAWGAARGALGAVRNQAASLAGTVAGKGEEHDKDAAAFAAAPRAALRAGLHAAAEAGYGMAAVPAAGASGRGSLDAPTGAMGAMEAQHAEARAGADLAGHLEAGTDYTRSGNGVSLTAAGRRKVAEYRQGNRAALRSFAGIASDDEFVNTGSIGSTIANGGPKDHSAAATLIGPHDGSAEHTIARALSPSITAVQQGETPQHAGDRVVALTAKIRQQAGGSWQRAEQLVSELNRQSARVATSRDGKTYGIKVESVGAPASAREYTGEQGSAFEVMRASHPNTSQDKLYNVCRDAQMRAIKKNPVESVKFQAMSAPAQEEHLNALIFTNVPPGAGAATAVATTTGD